MAFVALETGLKINRFSELPGGTPEFMTCTSGTLKCLFPGAVEDHLPCLMIHFNKTSDTNCESTRHQDCKTMTQGNASQPGGPKGPADIYIYIHICISCATQGTMRNVR